MKISPFAHIYQHAFTICGICGVFTITLIWIVQNYLQMLFCLVISIIATHFLYGIADIDLTRLHMDRINWPTQ